MVTYADYKTPSKRKRGRPSAEIPNLTPAQRKARNAQYERERRVEEQAAFADLSKALSDNADSTQKIGKADILRKATMKIYRIKSIEEIKRENELIQTEIDKIMAILEDD